MSGPKVVRIVTRNEKEAIKASQVSRVKAMVEEIERYAEKYDLLDKSQIEDMRQRLEHYQELDAEHYLTIAREIPSQITFLRNVKKDLETIAKTQVIPRRKKVRHLKASIKSLISMYETRSLQIPSILTECREPSWRHSEKDIKKIEQAIHAAFDSLVKQQEAISDDSLELSRRLNLGDKVTRFDAWVAQTGINTLSRTQQRLESILAELEVTDIEDQTKTQLVSRANALLEEEPSQTLDMRIDSLCIDISNGLKHVREKQVIVRDYIAILNDLARLGFEQKDQIDVKTATIEILTEAVASLEAQYVRLLKEKNAEAKRTALLNALNKMGYKVDEKLETALVRNGRLVLSKNPGSSYGVEVGSASDFNRVQLRVVADEKSKDARSQSADTQAEDDWCGDFGAMREHLSDLGIDIEIDRQFASGEKELKQVDFNDSRWVSSSTRHAPSKRTL